MMRATPRPETEVHKEVSVLPNYENELTSEVIKRLGPYDYTKGTPPFGTGEMETKPAIELSDGVIYIGEWDSEGRRCGKGKQLWPDGTVYEGYWLNDHGNGEGRLIHPDGDVYKGQWLDDKAHGYGEYIHQDGSYYQGEWVFDKQQGKG